MLLSWMIVSSCTIIYFFLNKFIFLNVYISVNTIFECFYMFFGWERGHPLSAYATSGCMKWSSEIRTAAHKESERGCYAECVLTPLHYLFPCFFFFFFFFAAVLFYSFSSYLWKFKLPFIQTWFKKDEFVRAVVLLQQNQFISSRNKLFYLKSFFCEPKLVKTLSVFFSIKLSNLHYTNKQSVQYRN